jgi:gamma-aminobutyric acid type B receptor
MTIPWLGFLGFSITFSAMFSKTWRVNQFFKSSNAHGRIQVRERDVLLPFFFIFTLNTIILICWTIIDPLVYTRRFADGTDLWNRDIASSGSCRSENGAVAYLAPLGVSKYQSILNLLHLLS